MVYYNNNNGSNRFSKVLEEMKICRTEKQRNDKLLDLGFVLYTDTEEDPDLLAEKNAVAQNEAQIKLASYFGSNRYATDELLTMFYNEKHADLPNFDFFRSYFRHGNQQLKCLLLYGLNKNPTDIEILGDFAFFNEFCINLNEFIEYFTHASLLVLEIDQFEEIFYQ